jgi:hypothetical protein
MADCLISTRLLKVISNRSAGNGRSRGQPRFPDVQSHFRGHEGVPGLIGYQGCLIGEWVDLKRGAWLVFYPTEPALPFGGARRVGHPSRVSRTGAMPENPRTLRSSPRTLCSEIPSVNQCWHLHRDDEPRRSPGEQLLREPVLAVLEGDTSAHDLLEEAFEEGRHCPVP